MKQTIFIIWFLICISEKLLSQKKDSFVNYNSMQTKAIISDKTIYSYYNKKGKLLLKYDYNQESIQIDSMNSMVPFYSSEMDSLELKTKYDVPPTLIFSECFGFSRFKIEYPIAALEANAQGLVKITLSIDRYGNVINYSTKATIGYDTENSCIKELKKFSKCWFPAIKNRRAVDSELTFTFHFIID